MIVFRKKRVLIDIFLIVICIFWFLFALRLSFTNIQLLYKDAVVFHNRTSTEKLKIILKEEYPLFEYIVQNTPSHATVLLISNTKNVFFDYYLYPRKIIWSDIPANQLPDAYFKTRYIDVVISYDENNNLIQQTIRQ